MCHGIVTRDGRQLDGGTGLTRESVTQAVRELERRGVLTAQRNASVERGLKIIEREVPGLAEGMRAISLQYTPMAMLSRGVAGVRGRTLIVNLPGSPKAVKECLEYILPVLPHGINLLTEGPKEH